MDNKKEFGISVNIMKTLVDNDIELYSFKVEQVTSDKYKISFEGFFDTNK